MTADMKKIVTTVQITLDVIHDEDLDSTRVALLVGNIACDAITWADDPDLKRATDSVENPVRVVSAVALATCLHAEEPT
jgi:hypothetical protein